METPETDVVIVGGGPGGLAVGAVLSRLGLRAEIVDREDAVGASWRDRYERLHLHTDRARSGLPYKPMPRTFPRYPSKDQVSTYLQDYARHFDLRPHLGCEVTSVARHGDGWITRSTGGSWASRCVVIATSTNGEPHIPEFDGQDRFRGPISHSADYTTGEPFSGKDVLVVGFGNSGGEIAIDLHECGARPAIAVRSAVNVLPKELFGIPILAWGIVLSKLPPRVGDIVARPLLRLSVGDITRPGLRRLPYGPQVQIARDGRIPLIDVGTMALVRSGAIAIRGGIERFEDHTVVFDDGRAECYDAVVLATGFRPRLDRIVAAADGLLDRDGGPMSSGCELSGGLYTCGFYVSPTGMLRELGIEARRIGSDMKRKHFPDRPAAAPV